MRIVIDMQGAQTASRFRGIGRYTLAFAQAVVRNRGDHEVFLVLNGLFPQTVEPIRQAFKGLLPKENICLWYAPGPVQQGIKGNTRRWQAAELVRDAFLRKLQPDIVHLCSLFEGYVDNAVTGIGELAEFTRVSVTLYDLIPLVNPEVYLDNSPDYAGFYNSRIKQLNSFDLCLAISDFSRQEGLRHLHLDENRVFNVSTSIDSFFRSVEVSLETASSLMQKFGIDRPFILYTGGVDERKNLPRLIEAFARLPASIREKYQLLFAGRVISGEQESIERAAGINGLKKGELCMTGYITDQELLQLYNLAHLFVFPSWHEGFGLPPLEAMACGAPVIAANATSLPEVINNPDALFDPRDVGQICEKMLHALEDKPFRQSLIDRGLLQRKNFSWDKVGVSAITHWTDLYAEKSHVNSAVIPEMNMNTLIRQLAYQVSSEQDAYLLALANAMAGNFPKPGQKQLFVDISELINRDVKTGIQRVVRSIANSWLANPPADYCVRPVYATLEGGYRHAHKDSPFSTNDPDIMDEPIEFATGDIFVGLDLQVHMVVTQRAFLRELKLRGVAVYFVVYDLLCVTCPECFPEGSHEDFLQWLDVVSESDGAMCISQSVEKELQCWMTENAKKPLGSFYTGWFHLGADVENSLPSKGMPEEAPKVLSQLALRPTFLMVGTLEPRKGHAQVLDAFDLLWQDHQQINLVIVGKPGWLVDDLLSYIQQHSLLNVQLFFLSGISDEYLTKVYAASRCLIAASYDEGFGLPLIEAAQHQLPLIARDIPVFREVAAEQAYYFNSRHPEALATTITQWLSLYENSSHPKSENISWLTWQESANNLLQGIIELQSSEYKSDHGDVK